MLDLLGIGGDFLRRRTFTLAIVLVVMGVVVLVSELDAPSPAEARRIEAREYAALVESGEVQPGAAAGAPTPAGSPTDPRRAMVEVDERDAVGIAAGIVLVLAGIGTWIAASRDYRVGRRPPRRF